jgi:hypothetical protein
MAYRRCVVEKGGSMSRGRVVLVAGLLALVVAGIAVASGDRIFRVHASGEFEVPTRDTDARGRALFKLTGDGESLHYRLVVRNIENVIMAHIHLGAPGTNGPVVVWLYPSTTPGPGAPGGGALNGEIAEGVITAANLGGPLAGQTTLAVLVDSLRNGQAYVNVHTDDGVPPVDTGPGDFPAGEIRGNF